ILRELELAETHKHYELNTTSPNHQHHIVCAQCNMTIEFDNSTILKQAIKQVEKSNLELIDCQLTIYAVCPEAIRKGFTAIMQENWVCSRARIAEDKLEQDLLIHG
ncbi:MAG: transcriptional repressor, partial [Cyanobacteria bacterium J06649_11]